jgi:hypothetical protein
VRGGVLLQDSWYGKLIFMWDEDFVYSLYKVDLRQIFLTLSFQMGSLSHEPSPASALETRSDSDPQVHVKRNLRSRTWEMSNVSRQSDLSPSFQMWCRSGRAADRCS